MHTLGVNWHVPRFPQGAGWRYAIALVGFLLSFFLREVLSAWLHDRDFVVFVPAIILIAFFADLGPAILTTLLSGIAVWYFFTPPFHSFRLDVDGVTGLATFLLSSAVAISLIHWVRVTNARLRAERARAEQAEWRIAADLHAMTQLVQLSHRLVRERTKIDDCLNEVIETAISVSGADKGTLQLLNSDSGTLTIAAQRGFETPFLRYFANVRDDATACAAAMRSRERIVVEDVTSNEMVAGQPSQAVLIDAGVRAVISTPLASSTGALLGMVSVHFCRPPRPREQDLRLLDLLARQAADYLERKRAEEIEETLIREVQHRSNNLLTVVQAIANLTLSGEYSPAQARAAFEARLQALARANRQLTRSNWVGVNLNEIVRLELEPFADRAIVEGADVVLGPQQAQNFSLALHELATNAAKYGALANGTGMVEVSWALVDSGKNTRLKFKWQEQGGPPVVAPTRRGFGTSLLKATFAHVRIDYLTEGLRCGIEVSLSHGKRDMDGNLGSEGFEATERSQTDRHQSLCAPHATDNAS